jgi:hypothetical protein
VLRSWLVLACCAALAACFQEVDCVLVPATPVTAEVLDSVTGQPAAGGATGELQGVDEIVVMRPISERFLQAERLVTGIFAMRIQKSGYRDYQVAVRVRDFECGPETVQTVVRLVPL